MGFGREMRDFAEAFRGGYEVGSKGYERWQKTHKPSDKELEGMPGYTGGTGEIGTTPGTDPGKTGSTDIAPVEIAWNEADPTQKAFLNTLAGPESGGEYNIVYGGEHFEDYSKHPGIYTPIKSGPNKGKTSSAAGKYQFLESTWNDIAGRYGLKDFSPANQDKAAWILAAEKYAQNTKGDKLLDALNSGDAERIANVGKVLSPIWTSLPSGIEQGTTTDKFVSTFNKYLQSPDTQVATEGDGVLPEPQPDPGAGTGVAATQGSRQAQAKTFIDAATASQMDPDIVKVTERAARENPNLFAFNPKTKTLRTEAEQQEMVDKGWSKTMDSKHRKGKAVDLVPINPKTGQPDPDYSAGYGKIADAMRRAAEQEGVKDLDWGGDWTSFQDKPHWQVSMLEQQRLEGGLPTTPEEESQVRPTMFAAAGGVIPEPTQYFQDGGLPVGPTNGMPQPEIDRFARSRDYTQLPAAAAATGFVPRRVGTPGATVAPAAATAGAQGSYVERFRQMQADQASQRAAAAAAKQKAAADAAAAAAAAKQQQPAGLSRKAMTAMALGIPVKGWQKQATPQQYTDIRMSGGSGWGVFGGSGGGSGRRGGHFAEGGIIPEPGQVTSYARGGTVEDRDATFQRLLKNEMRRGGSEQDARDRAAKRLSRQEGRPTSSAYRPTTDKKYFTTEPAPRGKKSPKTTPKADPITTGTVDGPTHTQEHERDTSLQSKAVAAGTPTAGYEPKPKAVAAGTPTAGYEPKAVAAGTPTAGYEPTPPGALTPGANRQEEEARIMSLMYRDRLGPGQTPDPERPAPPAPPAIPEPLAVPVKDPRTGYSVNPQTGSISGAPSYGPPGAEPPPARPAPAPVTAADTPIPDLVEDPKSGYLFNPQSGSIAGKPEYGPPGGEPPAAEASTRPDHAAMIGFARDQLKQGVDPSEVADKLRMLGLPEDLWPIDIQSATLGFQEGGMIPEPGQPGYNEAVAEGRTATQSVEDEPKAKVRATPELQSDVSRALDGGIKALTRIFGLRQDGAVPTPESGAMAEQGARRFASGEGAATAEELEGIDDNVDPERELDEGHRQMNRLAQTMNWYKSQGRDDEAEVAAASLMQYGAQRMQKLGSMSAAAYKQYQATGDKQHLDNTLRFMEKAYQMVPDGANFDVQLDRVHRPAGGDQGQRRRRGGELQHQPQRNPQLHQAGAGRLRLLGFCVPHRRPGGTEAEGTPGGTAGRPRVPAGREARRAQVPARREGRGAHLRGGEGGAQDGSRGEEGSAEAKGRGGGERSPGQARRGDRQAGTPGRGGDRRERPDQGQGQGRLERPGGERGDRSCRRGTRCSQGRRQRREQGGTRRGVLPPAGRHRAGQHGRSRHRPHRVHLHHGEEAGRPGEISRGAREQEWCDGLQGRRRQVAPGPDELSHGRARHRHRL